MLIFSIVINRLDQFLRTVFSVLGVTDQLLSTRSLKLTAAEKSTISRLAEDKYRDYQKDYMGKRNASVIIENSHVSPFRWLKNGFLCFFCDEKYTDPKELREHSSMSHAYNKIWPFVSKMKRHDLVKIDITLLDCRLCSYPTSDVDSLKEHLILNHNQKINQDYNDGVIPFKFDKEHFYCHICNKQFNVFITLNNHMNTHFQNFICETCGKGFATAKRLQAHSYSHVRGDFPCTACDKVFPSNAMRTNHILRYHKEAKTFKCPQCSDVFKTYLDRNKHRRIVHNVTSLEYRCPMCPKVFSLSGKRTYHIKQVHIRERNHACNQCEWKFFSKAELQEHMIKHNGERIHQCDVCKKAFARKHTLKEHLRIHNDDRRFVCFICGQSFIQNCSRKYHMRVHHPEAVLP